MLSSVIARPWAGHAGMLHQEAVIGRPGAPALLDTWHCHTPPQTRTRVPRVAPFRTTTGGARPYATRPACHPYLGVACSLLPDRRPDPRFRPRHTHPVGSDSRLSSRGARADERWPARTGLDQGRQGSPGGVACRAQGSGSGAAPDPRALLRTASRRAVRELSSLPLAIGTLFAIAGACALGTVIEQGAAPAAYLDDYPAARPVLGFLTGDLILGLGLDHVYTNPAFLALLLLLAACLSACTSTRQLPMLRVARRWSFFSKPSSVLGLQFSESLPSARLADVAVELRRRGYEVFRQGPSLYGFKGLAGRLAPIGVHAAMLLIMVGATCSAVGGFQGSVMLPQGLQVLVPDALRGNSALAMPSSSMNLVLQLDQFSVDYRPNGEVRQYFSDLRVLDFTGREVAHKTISVNDPLRCQGVTVYQTDWAISAVQLRVDGQDSFKLPVASLPDPSGTDAKLFGTFLPLQSAGAEGSEKPRGITILARDFQSVVLYDAEGKFVGVRRPGSRKPIVIDGVSIVVDDIIGSSGMELKMDPGVPLVYTGFGSLILTTFISYLSHSQVWALQEGSTVHVGGRTNRAKYSFQDELNEIADRIPEVVSAEEPAGTGEPGGVAKDVLQV